MTIDNSIGRFPEIRAAYEGAKHIVEDLKSLAHLATADSKVGDPVEGQVIHLPLISSHLTRTLKAKSKAIRELEAELASSDAQPIRIEDYAGPCAACLAIVIAFNIKM